MPTTQRTRRLFPALAIAAVVVAVGAGIWLQVGERLDLDTANVSGASDSVDGVDIDASVQRVDAAGRELVLRVLVVPRGGLTDDGGLSPNEDLVLLTSPDVRQDLTFKADTRIATVDVPVALSGGSITDYPFDGYRTGIEFAARQGGHLVPVTVTLSNRDALFHAGVNTTNTGALAAFDVSITRSNSVLIYAIFMMLAMWALAIAVAIGTRFLVSRRRGLVWPALSWMAATLFALAAFRNTAPGSPPIGSLMDYVAFLWAEAIIAFCLVTTVVAGVHAEPAEPVPTPEPEPEPEPPSDDDEPAPDEEVAAP